MRVHVYYIYSVSFYQDLLTSFIQHFHLVETDIWKSCCKYEWIPYLHNLCLLHCALLQRFHNDGFQATAPFNYDTMKFFVSKIFLLLAFYMY